MNESPINEEHSNIDQTTTAEPEPQFGLLDIVEAFTAMRHEWRTQSKQSRDLAKSIESSSEMIAKVDSTLDQKLSATTGQTDLRSLVSLIIDLDIGLTRAVDATSIDEPKTDPHTELLAKIKSDYERSGFFARRFGRKLYQKICDTIGSQTTPQPVSAVEGFRLMHNRLRRTMAEQGLERIETVGQPFNGETMKSISAVETDQDSAGTVVEQITAAYLYKGQLARVAEVRVAK